MPQLSYVDVSKVLEVIGYGQNTPSSNDTVLGDYMNAAEELLDRAFDWVTFGDASYTLVGNNIFIESTIDYLKRYRHITTDEGAEQIRTKFWSLVGDQDYINMEG